MSKIVTLQAYERQKRRAHQQWAKRLRAARAEQAVIAHTLHDMGYTAKRMMSPRTRRPFEERVRAA